MPQYADTSGYTEAEIALWDTLALHQGQTFSTLKGLSFTYKLKGNEMFITRKEKSITRATVNIAYQRAMALMERDGFVSGPKKLETFGASYLYPIFKTVGIIVSPEKTAADADAPHLVKHLLDTAKPASIAKALVKMGLIPAAAQSETAAVCRRLIVQLRGIKPACPRKCVAFGVAYQDESVDAGHCAALVYDKASLLENFRLCPELDDLADFGAYSDDELFRILERNKLPDHTGCKGNSWAVVLGYEIDRQALKAFGTSRFLAILLWEMTLCDLKEQASFGARPEMDLPAKRCDLSTMLKNHVMVYRVLKEYVFQNSAMQQLRLF